MNYKEFCALSGKLSDPSHFKELLESQDSVHVLLKIGTVFGDEFKAYEVGKVHEEIVSAIKSLEERGAVRERDYIVTCWGQGLFVVYGLHTKNNFISPEDFPDLPLEDRRDI